MLGASFEQLLHVILGASFEQLLHVILFVVEGLAPDIYNDCNQNNIRRKYHWLAI